MGYTKRDNDGGAKDRSKDIQERDANAAETRRRKREEKSARAKAKSVGRSAPKGKPRNNQARPQKLSVKPVGALQAELAEKLQKDEIVLVSLALANPHFMELEPGSVAEKFARATLMAYPFVTAEPERRRDKWYNAETMGYKALNSVEKNYRKREIRLGSDKANAALASAKKFVTKHGMEVAKARVAKLAGASV